GHLRPEALVIDRVLLSANDEIVEGIFDIGRQIRVAKEAFAIGFVVGEQEPWSIAGGIETGRETKVSQTGMTGANLVRAGQFDSWFQIRAFVRGPPGPDVSKP